MELNARKRRILGAIIEDYIGSAEPVGSRTISKHADMGLSSATIRNEMADLEELGYLISPHTSAGRIPTDAGYRFYVNELMGRYSMSLEDITNLRRYFTAGILQLDRLIRQAGDLVSQLTSYTTVSVTPEIRSSYIKRFEIIPVDETSALLVMVTSEGVVKNQLISVRYDESLLRRLSAALNEELAGLTLEDINLLKVGELQQSIGVEPAVLMHILGFIGNAISELNGSEIYIANAQNILKYPEYRDIGKARELMEFLQDKESVKRVVDNSASQAGSGEVQKQPDGINIVIGSENPFGEMRETSIVTAGYVSGGRQIGKLAILGPTRMDYARVVTAIEYITENLDVIISELYKEEFEDTGRKE